MVHDMSAYLECYPERDGPAERVEIVDSPFVIGRSRSANLTIYRRGCPTSTHRFHIKPASTRFATLAARTGRSSTASASTWPRLPTATSFTWHTASSASA